MAEASAYRDQRSQFWKKHFDDAESYPQYLASSAPAHARKWEAMAEQIPPLEASEVARLSVLKRRLHVLVYSGVWCGDCVRQGPMLDRITRACPDAELRIIDRDVSPALQEELRVMGALRVPVVVFLSEDFWEIGRYGDRTLTAYRAKALREVGPACDAGVVAAPTNQLKAEQSEWVDQFERMLLIARLSPPMRERHED
ncbi:MAG: thioredoxin family protein [Candidatus Eisenbacteria bacterium]